jgi:hypothetical protein
VGRACGARELRGRNQYNFTLSAGFSKDYLSR